MDYIYNNKEYIDIVKDILENDKFMRINKCVHHGLSRLDHSLRVSYHSYIVAKKLKLDYVKVARAGLMHDFFVNEEDMTEKEDKISPFLHHKIALKNSCEYFDLSDMEKNIIYSHMFPLTLFTIPKYIESYLVSIIDKIVAVYDFSLSESVVVRKKMGSFSTSLFLFMIFCCRFNAL